MPFLHGLVCADWSSHVTYKNHLSDERVADAGTLEDGGTVVKEVVGTD